MGESIVISQREAISREILEIGVFKNLGCVLKGGSATTHTNVIEWALEPRTWFSSQIVIKRSNTSPGKKANVPAKKRNVGSKARHRK